MEQGNHGSQKDLGALLVASPRTPKEFEEYYDLRWRILRAPWQQPRGSEKDDWEHLADHVSARDPGGRLLGVGRLHLSNPGEAQIRYMATEPDCRGRGVGLAVYNRLESIAAEHHVNYIALNARETALGFYLKLGYEIIGDGPLLFGQIPHKAMVKKL